MTKSMQGQGYKLRLGDGTTFSVDEKGLMTWLNGGLVDNKARIQPDGSKKWYSVQQVLAANARTEYKGLDRESADKQAAAEASAIEKKLARERAAEERKAGESAATAERKAAEQARAAERRAAEEAAAAAAWQAAEERAAAEAREARAAAEAQAARERAAEQERADAERRAAEERAAAERRAAEARAEAEKREAEAREAARVAEAERLAAEELAERKRLAEEQKTAARREAEARAAEEKRQAEARAAEEKRQAEAKAAEARRQAEAKAAEERRQAEAKADAERREAEAREAARVAEVERKAAEESAARRRQADEQAARKRQAEEQKAAEERRAAEHAAAAQAAAAERRAAEVLRAAEQKRAADERRAEEARRAAEEAAALDALAPFEPPATAIPVESVAMPSATSFEGDVAAFHRELDLIPVADPVAAQGGRPEVAFEPRAARQAEPSPPPVAAAEPTGADVLRTTVTELGSAVSRVFVAAGPVTGGAAGWVARTAGRVRAAAPSPAAVSAWWKRTTASALKPKPEPAPEPLAAAAPSFTPPARVVPTPVAEPVTPPVVEARVPAPPAPRPAPTPSAPRPSTPTPPAPTVAKATPPPSFKDLPVIPFAGASGARGRPVDEPAEDVWDGDDFDEPGSVGSLLATGWLWIKRATIAAALIAGTAVLAVNREAWLPRAKSDLTTLGGEVDRYASRAMAKEIPPQAIEAASQEIPHLTPETLGLVMARSGKGPLEPVDVFRRAYDAAEGGRASLGQAASDELDALNGLLAAELPEGERERLTAYLARVRSRAVTASYEDREAMWLMARAARRFPPDRLARLQALLGQAVAAGLPPPGA